MFNMQCWIRTWWLCRRSEVVSRQGKFNYHTWATQARGGKRPCMNRTLSGAWWHIMVFLNPVYQSDSCNMVYSAFHASTESAAMPKWCIIMQNTWQAASIHMPHGPEATYHTRSFPSSRAGWVWEQDYSLYEHMHRLAQLYAEMVQGRQILMLYSVDN